MKYNYYRGKRKDNGEWTVGRLLSDDRIVPLNKYTLYGDLTFHEVNPETVNQLVEWDNDHMFFEGDIVIYKCESGDSLDGFPQDYVWVKAVITYDSDRYCWSFMYYEDNGDFSDICPIYDMVDCLSGDCSIIGNIYDNPEMIAQYKVDDIRECCNLCSKAFSSMNKKIITAKS